MGHPNRAPFDAAVWVLVTFAMFNSGSDPATRGLDQDAAYIVTALFLITACPCVELHGRAPRTALILGLTYPAAFTALFMAVIIASA